MGGNVMSESLGIKGYRSGVGCLIVCQWMYSKCATQYTFSAFNATQELPDKLFTTRKTNFHATAQRRDENLGTFIRCKTEKALSITRLASLF